MHLLIRTTKISEIFGLKNLKKLLGIPSFPSEFKFLRFEQILKNLVFVVAKRKIDFLHVLERTSSLLRLIFAYISLSEHVKNSLKLEDTGNL